MRVEDVIKKYEHLEAEDVVMIFGLGIATGSKMGKYTPEKLQEIYDAGVNEGIEDGKSISAIFYEAQIKKLNERIETLREGLKDVRDALKDAQDALR